jgi:rubredoxin
MPLILLHRRYERRCNACGHVWEVPRGLAGMSPPSMAPVDESDRGAGFGDRAESALETYEAAQRCPLCGLDDFTQRPLKKG